MSRQQRHQQQMQLQSVQGTMEVVKKSHGEIIFDIQSKDRARTILVKNNNISSIPSRDTKKICNELKKNIGCTLIASFNDEQKIAKLDKVRTVTINGKDVLRITASSHDFDAIGSFAKNIIDLDLDETPKTTSVLIHFWVVR